MFHWGNLNKLGGVSVGGAIISWIWLNFVVGSEEDIKWSNSFIELCLLIGGVFGEIEIIGFWEDFKYSVCVVGIVL